MVGSWPRRSSRAGVFVLVSAGTAVHLLVERRWMWTRRSWRWFGPGARPPQRAAGTLRLPVSDPDGARAPRRAAVCAPQESAPASDSRAALKRSGRTRRWAFRAPRRRRATRLATIARRMIGSADARAGPREAIQPWTTPEEDRDQHAGTSTPRAGRRPRRRWRIADTRTPHSVDHQLELLAGGPLEPRRGAPTVYGTVVCANPDHRSPEDGRVALTPTEQHVEGRRDASMKSKPSFGQSHAMRRMVRW